MKRKEIKRLFVFMLLSLLLVSPTTVLHANAELPTISTTDNPVIAPAAAITGYRYKKENGKTYKRLYNYSTGKWIGDWILVN